MQKFGMRTKYKYVSVLAKFSFNYPTFAVCFTTKTDKNRQKPTRIRQCIEFSYRKVLNICYIISNIEKI